MTENSNTRDNGCDGCRKMVPHDCLPLRIIELEAERDRLRSDIQRIYESHEHNVGRAGKIIEAGTALVHALNTRDGRAFMHRDAGLDGRWKTLRDELGIETLAPGART